MFSTFSPIFTIYVQRNISSIKYSALIMLLFNNNIPRNLNIRTIMNLDTKSGARLSNALLSVCSALNIASRPDT